MSQWKLPIIDSKKSFGQEQDYNFINKDKKKSKQNGALSMIDQLKYKIEEQKKQIDNRNITIMGLQRNFQSLSAIVKNQKTQSAALKAELENLKEILESGDKRVSQFHQKCVLLQNQNKLLKEELTAAKRAHSECYKVVTQSDIYKNKISQLMVTMEKIQGKLELINQEKKALEKEVMKYRGEEKGKRQLQERIIDLEQELKKSMDMNNGLNDRLQLQEDKLGQAKSNCAASQAKLGELLKKFRQDEIKIRMIESECDNLKKELKCKEKHSEQLKKNMDSMGLYSKVKQQQDDKNREQLKLLKMQCQSNKQQKQKLTDNLSQTLSQCNKKNEIIKVCEKELKLLREEIDKIKELSRVQEQKELISKNQLIQLAESLNGHLDQAQNLSKYLKRKPMTQPNMNSKIKLQELKQQLLSMNDKIMKHKKYYQYFRPIDENQSKGLILTNKEQLQKIEKQSSVLNDKMKDTAAENKKNMDILREESMSMKKYINSLETEVNIKSKQNNQKDKLIRQMEEKLEILKGEEKKLAETIAEERKKTDQFKKQSEQFRLKSQKQTEEEKQKSEKYKLMLKEYEAQEEKLKKLMAEEQQNMRTISKQKQNEINYLIKQKQIEIEKERQNNKLLWTDNKKLKDMEQKLRKEAEQQMQEIQKRKFQQMEKLKREIEKKYDEQLNIQKEEQSNSSELKKILQEKAQQLKTMTQNHNKIKSQLQFYKNRIKQLEGVVSRTQKNFKDQIISLQKQNKTQKEVISVLDKKNAEINLIRQQVQRKCKTDVEKLNDQLTYLKRKYEGQKIEEKIVLLKKSMAQFDTALKAIGNSLSCNYCLEPVKECIRLKECGHIYCKKCKEGYQPNCGECKKTSEGLIDKVVDSTISKSQYMKILLNTVKEDLSKISL